MSQGVSGLGALVSQGVCGLGGFGESGCLQVGEFLMSQGVSTTG